MKQAKSRREQFSQGGVSASLPPSAMSGHHQGSVLLADEQVVIDLSNMEPRQQMMQSQALIYDETVSVSHDVTNYFRFRLYYMKCVITTGS